MNRLGIVSSELNRIGVDNGVQRTINDPATVITAQPPIRAAFSRPSFGSNSAFRPSGVSVS